MRASKAEDMHYYSNSEMGCGKTLTAIAIAGVGYQLGKIKKVLIVAPTSVCAVWPSEFQTFADFPYCCKVLLGTKKQRLKLLEELERYPIECMKVAVINYESTWRDEIEDALFAYDADLVIADESQRIKSPDAAQSKTMHKLGDRARYKLILSGTPVQNDALDIWSQYRFLDPSVFGKNYYTFRARYAVMANFGTFRKVVGYRDMDELIKKEHSIAYRVTKEEALDLPEQTFQNQTVYLSPKEMKTYEQLRKDSFTELEDGGTITASTVLTKLLRLQQFTGGFLVEDEAENPTPVSHAKLDALEDIIKDYVISGQKKLVIFARFLAEIHAISALAKKLLEPEKKRFVEIYGAIPKENRGDLVSQFQIDPDTMIFIGQIDTAGTGITLHAADTCVYYSVNFNYAAYSQSLSRIHRIGQHHPCTYIHLVADKTVDTHILDALSKKEDLAATVVDNWRQFFEK